MERKERFGLILSKRDKDILRGLAAEEQEPIASVLRRLIRDEAKRCGLWPIRDAQPRGEVEPCQRR